jgi:hypothetical protein
LGTNALRYNTTGSNNTATGVQALFSNTAGTNNTANGYAALYSNAAGGANTANGYKALNSNTTGFWNTATGADALPSNTTGGGNTAMGGGALSNNTTGADNTAVGYAALRFAGSASNFNTAVGDQALYSATGSANTALGFEAGQLITTGDYNIDIANTGVVGDSGTIRIGSEFQTRTFIAAIRGVTTGVADAVNVVIDSNGQLGTISSSRRFKKEIKPMDKASEAILGLKPVTFHYTSDGTNTPQFGLIAEEVAKVNPALVLPDKEGKPYTVRYDAVNAMLLNEFLKEHRRVQEQNHKIQEQDAMITQLKQQMQTVVARLKEQDSKIQKVSAQLKMSRPAPQVAENNQ